MFSVLLMLLCCNDISITDKGIGDRLQVYPSELDFDQIRVNHEVGELSLAVFNTGDTIMQLEDFAIAGPDFACENCEEAKSEAIAPNEYYELLLNYSPIMMGESLGELSISVEGTEVLVPMQGYGLDSLLLVDPPELDFGLMTEGCNGEEIVRLENGGNIPVWLEDIRMVGGEYHLNIGMGMLPVELSGGDRRDILVTCEADVLGIKLDRIEIDWVDDINSNQTDVDVESEIVEEVLYNDSFVQTPLPILDVLLVIDDSGSMSVFQTLLYVNLQSFMQEFILTQADYNIAVVTTSNPVITNYVSWADPDPLWSIGQLSQVGVAHVIEERGIQMSYECIYDLFGGNCRSSGFWRTNSQKVVIYLSDERDQSEFDWDYYWQSFQSESGFKAYGIIGDYPVGCDDRSQTPYLQAEEGLGYYELIGASGGFMQSICSRDWGVSLSNISAELINQREFVLSQTGIDEQSIAVYVNGQQQSEWIFDNSLNAVIFGPQSIPEESDSIYIEYSLLCE